MIPAMFLVSRTRRREMDQLLPRRAPNGYGLVLGRAIRRILEAVHQSLERSRQRRALAQLSDALLRDVGLSRRDVTSESGKSFWRP
jgi:uncharacterized protein YjiS (DUF1127 family)